MIPLCHENPFPRSKDQSLGTAVGLRPESGSLGIRHMRSGFTLIELLVVMTLIALLLTLALPRYFQRLDRSKEVVLTENLRLVRKTLDDYYGDTGRYPESLEELVQKHYLRALPIDPITESDTTWLIIPPQPPITGRVADIHSGAVGSTPEGVAYGNL